VIPMDNETNCGCHYHAEEGIPCQHSAQPKEQFFLLLELSYNVSVEIPLDEESYNLLAAGYALKNVIAEVVVNGEVKFAKSLISNVRSEK
jgi:hypothetical protein